MSSDNMTESQQSIEINKMNTAKKWRNMEDFLKSHPYKKGTHPFPTHTRITNEELGIPGGCFYIPPEDLQAFNELYITQVFGKKTKVHFTEKQLEKGNILVDLDFRYSLDIVERQHNEDDIVEIRDIYLDELKSLYQFDDNAKFDIVVMQKADVNVVNEKKLTKDGIHIVITIPAKRSLQILLRKRVLEKLKISQSLGQLPIINKWEDVVDEVISKGTTNWQMYGSCKPGYDTYQITHWYQVGFDTTDSEFTIHRTDVKMIDMKRDFAKISAQYTNHTYEPFLKLDIAKELANNESALPVKKAGSTSNIRISTGSMSLGMGMIGPNEVMQLRNHDELNELVNRFMETTTLEQYVQVETYQYLMLLPNSYYDEGSYTKWMKTAWALRNLDPNRMFLAWVAFSAQAKNFDFGSISEMWNKWNKPEEIGNPGGLTWRSIMYWAKNENPAKFAEIQQSSISYFLDKTLDNIIANSSTNDKSHAGCGDYDIATMLYQMKKGEFVCTSVKSSQWYHFEKNRWVENDSGTSLRNAISTDLRNVYYQKANQLLMSMADMADDDARKNFIQKRIEKVLNIHARLGKTNDKKNIMTEAKELFYDRNFQKNIDANPYLLGFDNGVWDFKDKIFREGRPEDYLTKSTRINYVPFDEKRDADVTNNIHEFMQQLFPVKELETYMWEHLASTLIGVSANQTFHNYLGVGNNGKSVLVKLMEKTLGDYKVDLTPEFLMSPRPKLGGVCPEIVKLRGARYVCMSEPTKGSVMYEGPMKQITSGLESMEARAPFMTEMVEFVPQCKLILMTNFLVDVHAQDEGTWRRIRLVDFLSWFSDNPVVGDEDKPYQFKKDVTITEKFDVWKTVFMGMLVKKVLETGGRVNDCEMVTNSSNNYRKGQDVINEFVSERVVREKGSILRKAQVNFEFSSWHQNTYGNKGPKAKEVHDAITKAFFRATSSGWVGLKLKTDFNKPALDQQPDVDEEDMEEPVI